MKIFKSIPTLILINIFVLLVISLLISCGRDDDTEGRPIHYPAPVAHLSVVIKFDSLQDRLDNSGNISSVPNGHGAQSPTYNGIFIGLIELLADSTIPFGEGVSLMIQSLTINFSDTGYACCNSLIADGYVFNVGIDTSAIPNTFKYIRISFIYENFSIWYKFNGNSYNASVAAFLAPKTLAYNYHINDSSYSSFSVKLNGQWELEVDTPGYGTVLRGIASTTQPNVLSSSSPIPIGGCIVTCPILPTLFLDQPDTKIITISISSNKSFEWVDHSDPNYFEPFDGDTIVDVGIRGVKILQ